jgi:hypothetical protein
MIPYILSVETVKVVNATKWRVVVLERLNRREGTATEAVAPAPGTLAADIRFTNRPPVASMVFSVVEIDAAIAVTLVLAGKRY